MSGLSCCCCCCCQPANDGSGGGIQQWFILLSGQCFCLRDRPIRVQIKTVSISVSVQMFDFRADEVELTGSPSRVLRKTNYLLWQSHKGAITNTTPSLSFFFKLPQLNLPVQTLKFANPQPISLLPPEARAAEATICRSSRVHSQVSALCQTQLLFSVLKRYLVLPNPPSSDLLLPPCQRPLEAVNYDRAQGCVHVHHPP